MENCNKILLLLILLAISGTVSCTYASNVDHDINVVKSTDNHDLTASAINGVNQTSILYVSSTGSDYNNGLTRDKPLRTIQLAINRAKNGSKVKVAPGTYRENLRINKDIELIGTNPKNTVINGNNKNRCIIVNSRLHVLITGFTVTGGKNDLGAGIYNNGTLNLNNLIIKGNTAINGGAIYNKGELMVMNSSIINNYATLGGGISNQAICYLGESKVSSNTAKNKGGGINNMGTFYLIKSIINSNHAIIGGGIYSGGDLQIFETIIHSNSAETGGGVHNDNGKLSIQRTKILNNTAVEGGGIYNSSNMNIITVNISENTAKYGGGINNNGLLNLYNTIITENTAKNLGGGIYNPGRIYKDDYCTITKNIREDVSGNPILTSRST